MNQVWNNQKLQRFLNLLLYWFVLFRPGSGFAVCCRSALRSCRSAPGTNVKTWHEPSPVKSMHRSVQHSRRWISGVREWEKNRTRSIDQSRSWGGYVLVCVLVWSLRGELLLRWLPRVPFPWSPHTISVCRTSKDGSSPSCSPPSSSSPMWQLWREH